ncbi:MAG: hypothetical protein PHE83_03050 [Opitutaceae bacterium]|nr:hypothetical protein [Opitutaceae bacterium]
MTKAILKLFASLALAAALVTAGYGLLFTIFMLYDDEGYVLISLKHFGEGGALYDQVYSQYGPLFYLGYDTLRRILGFEWNSTAGRLITLVNWTGTAVCCAWVVYRARGLWLAALFALADVFLFLWIMIHEPMHPGGTLAFLVALGAWVGYEALRAGRPAAFAITVGMIGTALLCIKVNVGIFFLTAGALRLLMGISGRIGRTCLGVLMAGSILMPAALMTKLLGESWVIRFALVTALSIASVVTATPVASTQPVISWRAIMIGVGTALALLAAISLAMIIRGTAWAELLEGMLLGPFRHPLVYSFALRWRPGTEFVASGALLLLLALRRRPGDLRLLKTVAWVRLLALALFQLTLLPWLETSQAAIALCFGVPLAGLFALPLGKPDEYGRSWTAAQPWLALLLVFQALHAYPIAGSQLNWGTFLWVPLMVLGGFEALDFLLTGKTPQRRRVVRASALGALAGLAVFMIARLGQIATVQWRGSEPLGLKGAERLRLPSDLAAALRTLTTNIQAHGEMLFSLPGTFSFNLWSGVPPPTLADVTHWFSLLSAEQQRSIIDRLEASPRSLFLVQHNILHAIIAENFRATGPVMDYLRTHYHRAFAIEGYSLWVRNGREVAPLSTGKIEPGDEKDGRPWRLDLTLAACPAEIASIELWEVVDSRWLAARLVPDNAKVEITPIGLDCRPLASARPTGWPFRIKQVSLVTCCFMPNRPLPSGQNLLAVLLDPTGRRVGEARVLPANAFSLPPAVVPPASLK